jgi:RNA polymerase sigma-70 factor (ECF subfamily)
MSAEFAARLSQARTRWPDVELAPEIFSDHLRSLGAHNLEALHTDDLYLACACAQGNAAALAAFDRELMPTAIAAAERIQRAADFRDEVVQQLRERLFTGERKILGYTGNGPLVAWLRVSATRTALNLQRSRRNAAGVSTPEHLERTPAAQPSQDAQLLSSRYRQPLEEALQAALASLDAEQRLFLRQHYIDRTSIQTIADQMGVDRSTASRRVSAARAELLRRTRQHFMQRMQLSETNVDTIIRALRSHLDITLSALRNL